MLRPGIRSIAFVAVLCCLPVATLVAGEGAGQPGGPGGAPNPGMLMMQARSMRNYMDRASEYLNKQRNADGSYGRDPASGKPFPSAGLTAMALHALASTDRNYGTADGPFMSQPADWLVKIQKENGAIVADDEKNANYETSVAVMALSQMVKAGDKRYQPTIDKAVKYLKGCQYAPVEGDPKSGGVGYKTGDTNVDLPNTAMFIGALKYAGYDKDCAEYKNALAYLERCQASAEVNAAEWARAAKDGGGRYNEKGVTQDKGGQSTGALSYTLLMAYLALELPPADARMVAVESYVAGHYNLDEHPGLGADGLYYYYAIMAKALMLQGQAGGKHTVKTADGAEHYWALELSGKLISLQQADGSFVNSKSGKYWESDPVLCTAYAILTLNKCRLDMLGQIPQQK